MDLQEDIAAKLEILKTCTATEQDLLPQGDKVPADAQVFKDELARIIKYVEELQANTKIECDKYSNDVKFWAEYRTGIKEFSPWLASAEKSATEGLSKPSDLSEVQALNDKVLAFDKTCINYLKVLTAAEGASLKMTTHTEADTEVAAKRLRAEATPAPKPDSSIPAEESASNTPEFDSGIPERHPAGTAAAPETMWNGEASEPNGDPEPALATEPAVEQLTAAAKKEARETGTSVNVASQKRSAKPAVGTRQEQAESEAMAAEAMAAQVAAAKRLAAERTGTEQTEQAEQAADRKSVV